MCVLGLALEPVHDRGVLECFDRQLAQVLLEDLDTYFCAVEAADSGGSQVPLHVGVEETGDVPEIRRLLLRRRPDSWIAAGFDLADEQPFPVARFLHGLDGPLFAWLHPRHGEIVDRHPVALAVMRHVEPQVANRLLVTADELRHLEWSQQTEAEPRALALGRAKSVVGATAFLNFE